jgi:hypothetical protein
MFARSVGLALTAVAAVTLGLAAQEESPQEQSLREMLKALDRITTTLANVKDAETAQAARPELKKAVDNWVSVTKKAEALPPPDQAEKDRIARTYKGKMDEATKKFLTEAGRIRKLPEGKQVLNDLKPVKVITP